MPRQPLTLPERDEIAHQIATDPNITWTELGERLGRHRTTVAREVARHGGRHAYRAAAAQ